MRKLTRKSLRKKGEGACSGGSIREWPVGGSALAGFCLATCLVLVLFLTAGGSPAAQAAASQESWLVSEVPLATAPGDQLSPAVAGTSVAFNDLGVPGGRVVVKDLGDPAGGQQLAGPGIWAGPAMDGDGVAWQGEDSQVCRRPLDTDTDDCVASAAASSVALSGTIAVTGESNGGSTISRINFETGRSRKLDSHALPGMRFDPDIDGSQAVWVKLRGYGSKYYEPLIVSYDVSDDSWSYLTRTGGGGTAAGESIYERRGPSVSNGRVLYQQRLNQPGSDWDIYEAVADTFGVPAVEAPGDQVNPSLDGELVVYQDNRNGHADGSGGWVDDWDIYIMDLETGREQLLAAAPGDQVNPVIRGNVVAWEDNRNGDWDIYAAEITPAGGQQPPSPDLALSRGNVYWDSYQAYTAGELSVDFSITNRGEAAAETVTLAQVTCEPASVSVAGPLPEPIALLEAGQTAPVRLRYSVPDGVGRFNTRLYAACSGPDGVQLWYPKPPPL